MKNKERYTFEDFKQIMKTLRSEQGCPWDKEQTHESLMQCLLEETYEVIDGIKKNDMENLKEELGDLLLQVVFHAQIADENGSFAIEDVIDGISKKMIIRHPHIFGDVHADTSEKVLKNWENIKKQEKGYQSQTEVLKSVPEVLPALIRAYKVQSKAAQVGFDWSQIGQAMEKVDEEWDEFKEAHEKQQRSEIEEEFGDLLFAVVNIARFLKLNPEFALTKCIEKFINRFEYIENTAVSQGNTLENMTLEEMDSLWDEAKRKLS